MFWCNSYILNILRLCSSHTSELYLENCILSEPYNYITKYCVILKPPFSRANLSSWTSPIRGTLVALTTQILITR